MDSSLLESNVVWSELNRWLGGGETLVNADGEEYYNPANLVRYDSQK